MTEFEIEISLFSCEPHNLSYHIKETHSFIEKNISWTSPICVHASVRDRAMDKT